MVDNDEQPGVGSHLGHVVVQQLVVAWGQMMATLIVITWPLATFLYLLLFLYLGTPPPQSAPPPWPHGGSSARPRPR